LKNADFDIKKEAAWALSNATSGGSAEQIRYLVDNNIIEPLCHLLTCGDARIILVGLEALDNILKMGAKHADNGENPYAGLIEECSGLDNIEDLQSHANTEIYEKVVEILECHFAAEEEDENTTPNIAANGGAFSFGLNGGNGGFHF